MKKLQDNQIAFYQSPDGSVNIEVLYAEENIWLTQKKMMVLLLILVAAPSLCAGPSEKHISKRISDLKQGIDSGMQTGTVTPDEGKKPQSRKEISFKESV